MDRPTPAGSRPSALTINLLVGVLCLIWSSTWLVIREGLRDLPPLTGASVRFTLAAAVFWAIAPALQRKEGGLRPSARMSLFMGVVVIAIPYGVVYWGETLIPSALACLLFAVYPMMLAALAHRYLPQERLAARHALGFLVGFLGVVLLFATDIHGLGPAGIPVAIVFLLSPLASAVGNIVLKRCAESTSSVLLNRNGLLIAALCLWVASALTEHGAPIRWSGLALFSVGYLAIPGTVVTFGLYFWLLRHAPAYKLSLIAYVTPALAMALGALVGQETIGASTVAGAAAILAGVGLVARK